jgi:hypothetical protein
MSAKTSAIAGAWSAFGESHYRRGDCDSLHPRLVGRIISWKQHSESECLGLVARKGRYTIVWQKIRCTLRLTLKRDLDLVPLQKCSGGSGWERFSYYSKVLIQQLSVAGQDL